MTLHGRAWFPTRHETHRQGALAPTIAAVDPGDIETTGLPGGFRIEAPSLKRNTLILFQIQLESIESDKGAIRRFTQRETAIFRNSYMGTLIKNAALIWGAVTFTVAAIFFLGGEWTEYKEIKAAIQSGKYVTYGAPIYLKGPSRGRYLYDNDKEGKDEKAVKFENNPTIWYLEK